jgi:predicted Rossmann fold nucleotide-binding protein DprA/Smf involved in DNA uptake
MNTNEKTMTARIFYQSVIEFLSDNDKAADVVEYAEGAIAKLDAINAKRKEKTDKKSLEKAAENAPLLDTLVANLTTEPKTASDMMDLIGQNVQKTSTLLRQLVAAERASVQDVKVKGKGTQKGYTVFIAE